MSNPGNCASNSGLVPPLSINILRQIFHRPVWSRQFLTWESSYNMVHRILETRPICYLGMNSSANVGYSPLANIILEFSLSLQMPTYLVINHWDSCCNHVGFCISNLRVFCTPFSIHMHSRQSSNREHSLLPIHQGSLHSAVLHESSFHLFCALHGYARN